MVGLTLGLGLGLGPQARPAAAAGETLGPELWPQPDFDGTAGLTLGGWTVAGGQASSNAQTGTMVATALDTLVVGTYRIVLMNLATGTPRIIIGGGGTLQSSDAEPGLHSYDVVVASVANQTIRVTDVDEAGIVLDSLSIKLIG